MAEHDNDEHLVDVLAEEFARRVRAGEHPSVADYIARYPQHADEIRDVLPAVAMMEQFKPRREEPTGPPREMRSPSAAPLRIGDYRIVREIGRGGMGVVYEAVQESLGRSVAIKVLPAQVLQEEKRRARFHREAHAAARLHHTNIVPVFTVGEQDGMCFYVMQLIHGPGLDQIVRAPARTEGAPKPKTALDPTASLDEANAAAHAMPQPLASCDLGSAREVAHIGVQVADALAYAHTQGVLHRDVKPSNLLLDERGAVWVTDFGVAKLLEQEDLTQSGDLVGTLRYMPPERFAGLSDLRGDVYSLGITLYELLAQQPAFPDTTPHHLIQLITHETLPRLKGLNPAIPTDLETIILKAAARDPAQRYQTAGDLADDLRRFLDDRPIQARRIGPLGLAWRWFRRNPALAASCVSVLLLLLGITIVSVLASLRTQAAHAETETANREMEKALASELTQREHAETTAALALEALNRMYDRFAPTRIIVTPPSTVEEGEVLPPQPTFTPEAVPLLNELLLTYEQLARASQEFPRLHPQAAEANQRIGDLRQRLGRLDGAATAYQNAVDIYARLWEQGGPETLRIKLARSCNDLGRTQRLLQQVDAAERVHNRAIQLLTSAPEEFKKRPECRYELARSYYLLGLREQFYAPRGPEPDRPRRPGDIGPDRPSSRPGGPGRDRPPGDRPGGPPDRPQPSPADNPMQQAIVLLQPLAEKYPEVREYSHLLACCYRDGPPERPQRGQPQPLGSNLDEAIRRFQDLVDKYPREPDYRFDLCETLARGPGPSRFAHGEGGNRNRERLEQAIALSADLLIKYPNVPQYTAAHARYQDRLALTLLQARKLPEAEKVARKAISLQAGLVKQYSDIVAYPLGLGLMECSLARILAEQDRLKEAVDYLAHAITHLEEARNRDATSVAIRIFLGMAYRDLAQIHTRAGETTLAEKATKKADQFPRERPPGSAGPRDMRP